jgi:sugar phosphate isomerase/epimerase
VTQAAPNLFEPSAKDYREHEQWVRHTKRSIDFAAQVKSRVLVCHLGSVKFFWFNPARKVRRYLDDHPDAGRSDGNAEYQALLKKSVTKLRNRMGPFWEQTKASIGEVLEHAQKSGVKLGFENRERFEELPLDADHMELINSFPATAPVGYWHDAGHADLKEGMGLLRHREHLEKMAPRTLGFHLHDVSDSGHDHQPIGSGHIDFKMVSSFWRPEHLLTLEFSPRLSVEDVVVSKQRIEALRG